MRTLRKFWRGATSCSLFVLFGFGALALSPLILVLGNVEHCHPIVRWSWRLMARLFVLTRLIRLDRGNLPNCRGTILVANHPSLVDVLLLTSLIPRTISVAKRAVGRNPILSIVSRAVAVPVGAGQLEALTDHLDRGWNILVFPEGTRSPLVRPGETALLPFKRGAAQLALRSGAPVVCIGVGMSRRLLAKHQKAWDMGDAIVDYRFRADAPVIMRPRSDENWHAAAIRVTDELMCRVKGLMT